MYRKSYDHRKVGCARPINSIYRVMELLTLCFNQNVTCVTCVTQKHVSHATCITCHTYFLLKWSGISWSKIQVFDPLSQIRDPAWTILAVVPILYHRGCVQVASHTSRHTLWLEFHLYFGPLHELIHFFSGRTIIWLKLTKTSLTKVFWNTLKNVAIPYWKTWRVWHKIC